MKSKKYLPGDITHIKLAYTSHGKPVRGRNVWSHELAYMKTLAEVAAFRKDWYTWVDCGSIILIIHQVDPKNFYFEGGKHNITYYIALIGSSLKIVSSNDIA